MVIVLKDPRHWYALALRHSCQQMQCQYLPRLQGFCRRTALDAIGKVEGDERGNMAYAGLTFFKKMGQEKGTQLA